MGGARCDALLGLYVANHIQTKTASEIGPRVVIGDERCTRIRRQRFAPLLKARPELREKSFTVGDDAVAMLGRSTYESLRNARSDDDCVLGIEPVVRVAHAMRVSSLVHHALSAYLE